MANEKKGTSFKIEGEDIDFIKRTNLVRDYDENAKEGFKGKKYRIYAFGNEAFAVHEDDTFHADFLKGDIKSVMLTKEEEGLSFEKHITWQQANQRKYRQAQHDSISVENFKLGKEIAPTDLL